MRETIPMANPPIQYRQHTTPSEQKLDTIRTEAHTTYNVNYHIVTIPKYRRQILRDPQFKDILKEIWEGQAESRGWKSLAFEIQPDHIHSFLSVPPKTPVSYVVKILKGNSSIQLRRIFPKLIQRYGMGKHLWAKGFFVSTAGYISEDKVKRYIEEQKKHERIHQWNMQHPKGKQKQLSG